ncbi:glycoside hydrolase family 3 protein [Mycena crocata]|nr:glycoside hydrolase family 3 protein [Mycena crocata]
MLLLLSLLPVVHGVLHSNNTDPNTSGSQATPFAFSFPSCVNGPLSNNPVCDISKDPITRAKALISMFTTTELIQNSVHESDGVPRLGLPPYNWWSEASHGVSWTGPGVHFADSGDFSFATSFPQPIVLGAAFDDVLVKAVAVVISTEARAFNNVARVGLDFFTPNINPFRDPRWGRGQETPGEDPFHTARYVYQLVDGLQGGIDPKPYVKVIADCKHFAAYDMDDWGGVIQRRFDAKVTTQELSEFYLQPFQSCVRDAKVMSVMCSYNSVNGVPACAHDYLLQTVLREYWQFAEDRWVVSDCDAVQSIFDSHNYTDSFPSAAAAALKAGTDLNCGSIYYFYLQEALDQGLVERADIEKALVRQYASLIRLGYFDSSDQQPYRQLSWNDVSTPASQKLAYMVAVEGIVLLKNDGTLPLRKNLTKLALIGPWGEATSQMQGNYYGTAPFLISPHKGAISAGYDVTYVEGTSILGTSTDGFDTAVTAATAADIIVYAGGIDQSLEAEGLDRTSIVWPGAQLDLIKMLSELGKPLIVVQFGARQVDDTELLANNGVNSIIWAGYPGQSGGNAIFDVITGNIAPGGRLPLMQYPANYVSQVPMTDMNLRPNKNTGNPGRTYKWYTGTPVIEYGFGLHYTTFALSWQGTATPTYTISQLIANGQGAAHLDLGVFDTFDVTIKNTGNITSDFVALLFVKSTAGPAPHPNKELIAYTRVHSLGGGLTVNVQLSITLGSIARTDTTGSQWLYPGHYTLSLDVPEMLTHQFDLVGNATQLTHFPMPPSGASVSSS